MTPEGFWAALKAIGLTRKQRVGDHSWVCEAADGDLIGVPEPTSISEVERESYLELIKQRLGLIAPH